MTDDPVLREHELDGREELRMSVPAEFVPLRTARRRLAGWARTVGLAGRDVDSVVLAAYEALANAAEHAYPGTEGVIDLHAEVDGEQVKITVADQGRWRPPPADPGNRGRGLLLIRGLAHSSEVRHRPLGGTVVEMCWRLPGPRAAN
ncbi:MAG TPA: ATP-binding protein [Pseudonocardiaceae bacterium]|jgi:anti-sigma regulatory factor (Ser/Thr protein kinase)|nr:ATP-binding protein [Pseudonocardiaceae bacterium]